MLLVQKYGGTSLADGARILRAARRVAGLSRQGHGVVAVVSAQGDTTDELLSLARSIHPQPGGRELDACLGVGEQLSAALFALALESLGVEAVSLTGAQARIRTDGVYGNAEIVDIRPERILRELSRRKIVVVTGFQGVDETGNLTTLGRGGSDTTAVALAAWLGADKCQIFTDVEGVFDKDPRKYPEAARFPSIGYDEMLALIAQGAQVLHHRSVQLAKKRGVTIEVRSAFTDSPGTIVGEQELTVDSYGSTPCPPHL